MIPFASGGAGSSSSSVGLLIIWTISTDEQGLVLRAALPLKRKRVDRVIPKRKRVMDEACSKRTTCASDRSTTSIGIQRWQPYSKSIATTVCVFQ